jgi:hypothetical protein
MHMGLGLEGTEWEGKKDEGEGKESRRGIRKGGRIVKLGWYPIN